MGFFYYNFRSVVNSVNRVNCIAFLAIADILFSVTSQSSFPLTNLEACFPLMPGIDAQLYAENLVCLRLMRYNFRRPKALETFKNVNIKIFVSGRMTCFLTLHFLYM